MFDLIKWIKEVGHPRECNSVEFIYDDMQSQSNRSLPILYKPFNPRNRSDFIDRAQILDFFHSTGRGRLLDFGPGDGWPSLPVAQFVDEVVGLDASATRVEECRRNAAGLGLQNTAFYRIDEDDNLPLEDESIDGVMVATSLEQTPDPYFTLCELYRILKVGGRLRISYESLIRYKKDAEKELIVTSLSKQQTDFIIYSRHIDEEWVEQFRLTFDLAQPDVSRIFKENGTSMDYHGLNEALMGDFTDLRRRLVRRKTV